MNKLYRIRKGKIFFGVCGGLAKCFNVDAKIVRLLFTDCRQSPGKSRAFLHL